MRLPGAQHGSKGCKRACERVCFGWAPNLGKNEDGRAAVGLYWSFVVTMTAGTPLWIIHTMGGDGANGAG